MPPEMTVGWSPLAPVKGTGETMEVSMETTTQAPDRLFDRDVIDSSGSKVGTVDGVWVDDATNQLEFIGVKTGWLMGKTHLIPVTSAQIGDDAIQVPYAEDQIKDAPSFGTDAELTPDQEDEIYSFYGVDRSTAPSPTGLPEGGKSGFDTTDTTTGNFAAGGIDSSDYASRGSDTASYATSGTDTTDFAPSGADTGFTGDTVDTTDEDRVRLHEEELQVGKRQVEAGRARIRKVVRTEQVAEPVELRREEVDIERVPVSGSEVAGDAFQEGEIEVPVMREEPVVGKEARVTGEVRVGKDVSSETRTIEDEVRREDVEVDRGVDLQSRP